MRTALIVLATALTVSGLTTPAGAAPIGAVAPDSVGNDKAYDLVVTAGGFYPASQESVVLKANPVIDGQTDLTTTTNNVSACTGVSLPLSNQDCGDKLGVKVTTTNAAPGTYDVVETQTDQSTVPSSSHVRTLAVVTIYSQPTFTSVSPTSVGQGARSLAVTIAGTGFADGIGAALGNGVVVTDVRVQSPTSLTASVAVDPAAPVGSRDVVLTSADGHTATAAGAFAIAAGPSVDSVSPDSVLRGGSTSITVSGSHFSSDAALIVNGVTLSNVVINGAGTQITADVATTGTTPSGPRAVRVRNGDGGEKALDFAFSVLAPPGAVSNVLPVVGDGSVTLSWNPPSDAGSSAVTGYTVTLNGTAVAQTVVPATVTFTGLTNGSAYTFDITAHNGDNVGEGPVVQAVATPVATTALLLSTPTQVVAGRDVAFRGVLRRTANSAGVAGVTVRLTITPAVGTAFTRTVVTDSLGRFSFTTRPSYTTRLTAAFPGDSANRAAPTVSTTALVAARVAIASPASGAVTPAARTIAIVGSVSPNKAGRVVGLYTGTKLLGRAVVASNGSFRIPSRLPRGNYRVFVQIPATPGNRAGVSPAFILSRR